MTQPSFANQSNLLGDLRATVAQIEAAAEDAPATVGGPVTRGAAGVIAALENVIQTRADGLGRVLNDVTLAQAERVRRADALMVAAFAGATNAANALEAATATARATLEASFLPPKPAGVEEITILDRKGDLSALLANTAGSAADKVNALAKTLAQAAAAKDAISVYVLTQRMALVYQAAGLRDDDVKQAFASALGQATDASGQPREGAAFLALLQSGKLGTPTSVVIIARNMIYQAQLAWKSYVASLNPARYQFQ